MENENVNKIIQAIKAKFTIANIETASTGSIYIGIEEGANIRISDHANNERDACYYHDIVLSDNGLWKTKYYLECVLDEAIDCLIAGIEVDLKD